MENILEKGEMLVTSIFSFSHNFFIRPLPQDFVITSNSLPKDKVFDWSKLKGLADNKINVTQKLNFIVERVKNNVGKEKNAGYQHFLLFPLCFQKISHTGSSKVMIVW